MNLNPVDIASLLILVVLGLRAAIRGFVQEFVSVAGVLLGALGGWLFSARLAEVLDGLIGPGAVNQPLAFAAIFLVVFLIALIFRNALQNIVEGFDLQNADHVLGAIVGVVEGVVMVFVLTSLVELLRIETFNPVFHDSVTWQFFEPFIREAGRMVGMKDLAPALPPVQAILPAPSGN